VLQPKNRAHWLLSWIVASKELNMYEARQIVSVLMPVLSENLSKFCKVGGSFTPIAIFIDKVDSQKVLAVPLLLPYNDISQQALLRLVTRQGASWVCVLTGQDEVGMLWEDTPMDALNLICCHLLSTDGRLLESWKFPVHDNKILEALRQASSAVLLN